MLGAKSSNKFIPKDYLYAPIESRIDVLKGLIDTDGYMSGSCLYEYSTSSRQLAKDVQFICESLGFTVKISEKLPTYKYGSETLEGQKSYRLFIKTSKKIPKIHSSEKHEKAYKKPQSYARRYIKDIRKTNRYEEMTCISVDNEDELFLINNFIVTHNTRVLTKRIEYLISQGVSPSSILTFTFTKKASEEMKSRLNKSLGEKSNQVTIGTFHSVYYSILRDYNSRGMGRKKVDIAPDWWKEKTINEILSNFNTSRNFELDAKVILSMIAKQKNNLKTPNDDLVLADEIKFLESTYKEIYRQYEAKKDKENKIDFEDMVFKCYQIFKKDDSFLQYYRNKFKYILVDEFQDSNNLQEAILELITNDNRNIFVVGDARQSIYKFMEANVSIMLDFQEKWNSRLIELDINYRCSEDIVKYSNNLISHNKRALGGDAKANKPKHKEPIFFKSNSEYSESEEIIKEIQLILNEGKYKPDDITLLYRTNAQSQPLEEALMKADLPYVIIGGLGFYDRREIKDMLSYLQLSKNPHNDLAMLEVFNRPNRFLGKVFLQEITDYANRNNCSIYQSMKQSPLCNEWRYKKGTSELISIIDKLSVLYNSNQSVEYILNEAMMLTNYRIFLQKENEVEKYTDKIENIETLIRFTQDFSSASLFLEHIDNMKKAPTEEDTEGKIKLMSTHKSKGLEFPVVFVTGVSYGQFPFYREKFKSSFDLEEERRLMYVAMTRAEDILYISSIDSYRNTPLEESPFIKEMKEHKNKK